MTRQPDHMRRAWIEIDLAALRRNAAALSSKAGVPLLPMVKADAYGLGAVPVAKALQSPGTWGFGVATLEEGAELRKAGITEPVVVFTPLLPHEFADARSLRLTPALGAAQLIEAWIAGGGGPWHLSIDTGMARTGANRDEIAAIAALRGLERHPPEAVFTHLHSADRDDGSMHAQEAMFESILPQLPFRTALLHVENSAAIERRERSRWAMVRPGIFLYGVWNGGALRPEPVVSMRARVVALRWLSEGDTVSYGATWKAPQRRHIATVAGGYGDGYRQTLGNRATALVRGRRVPIVGAVTMDMTMVDVTGVECSMGEVVTLLGREGDDVIEVAELSGLAGVSPYEFLVALRMRLDRVYLDGS